MGTRIVDTEMWVPSRIQTADELAELIGRDPKWIATQTGVLQRRVADPGTDVAWMAAAAARPLLQRNKLRPDWLLFASATRRQAIPDTSVFVQRELQLKGVACMSVEATCLSFLAALQTADGLIQTGRASSVLVVSAEMPCRVRDFQQPESAALLGDGAAAALVCHDRDSDGSFMRHFRWETWPQGADFAEIRGGGHRCLPGDPNTKPSDNLFNMDGDQLLRVAVPRMRTFMRKFWAETSETDDVRTPADIDWVVPHQPSAASMRVLERLGFPKEKVINILSEYGNCVAASMPMALASAHAKNQLQQGQKLLLIGTAAGISLGAAVVEW